MAQTDRSPLLSVHEDAGLLHRASCAILDHVRLSREWHQLLHERAPGVLSAGDRSVFGANRLPLYSYLMIVPIPL